MGTAAMCESAFSLWSIFIFRSYGTVKKRKGGARDEIQTTVPAHKNGGKSLVLLQVNCRSIYNKALEFWNLVDTYNPDIIIDTESWFREEIGNTEIFRTDFTTFRRDRHARGGGVFICVKNNIACSEHGLTNSR
jgi:hypothetical protein